MAVWFPISRTDKQRNKALFPEMLFYPHWHEKKKIQIKILFLGGHHFGCVSVDFYFFLKSLLSSFLLLSKKQNITFVMSVAPSRIVGQITSTLFYIYSATNEKSVRISAVWRYIESGCFALFMLAYIFVSYSLRPEMSVLAIEISEDPNPLLSDK